MGKCLKLIFFAASKQAVFEVLNPVFNHRAHLSTLYGGYPQDF